MTHLKPLASPRGEGQLPPPQPPPDLILRFAQIRWEMFFFRKKYGGGALTLQWKSHHLLNGQAVVFWTLSVIVVEGPAGTDPHNNLVVRVLYGLDPHNNLSLSLTYLNAAVLRVMFQTKCNVTCNVYLVHHKNSTFPSFPSVLYKNRGGVITPWGSE